MSAAIRFGLIVFPGTNNEQDCYHVLSQVFGVDVRYIWHEETSLSGYDCIVLPGGFSYGDYLRTGAIARFSPVMRSVEAFADRGGLVFGTCNGFQILTEAGLLPGVLLRNECLEFRCGWVHVRVERTANPFTQACEPGQVLRLPIAHGAGRYFADEAALARLEENGQVLLRYCNAEGDLSAEANPNGSLNHIAGVCNAAGNVFGVMPHPERCCEAELGSADGAFIYRSMIEAAKARL